MDAIHCLLTRNACPRVCAPAPDPDEQVLILRSALRAPDHARLRPWRFISLKGDALETLGAIFLAYAKQSSTEALDEAMKQQAIAKGCRAPWVIVVVVTLTNNAKVPEIEQFLSAGAAAQNICLAAHALGYGAVWRTGGVAYSEIIRKHFSLLNNEHVVGLIYIGTVNQKLKALPQMAIKDFVLEWPSSG